MATPTDQSWQPRNKFKEVFSKERARRKREDIFDVLELICSVNNAFKTESPNALEASSDARQIDVNRGILEVSSSLREDEISVLISQ